MSTVANAVRTLLCLALAGFAAFGFLASFELGPHLGWKVGYAVLFFAALAAGLWPWVRRRS